MRTDWPVVFQLRRSFQDKSQQPKRRNLLLGCHLSLSRRQLRRRWVWEKRSRKWWRASSTHRSFGRTLQTRRIIRVEEMVAFQAVCRLLGCRTSPSKTADVLANRCFLHTLPSTSTPTPTHRFLWIAPLLFLTFSMPHFVWTTHDLLAGSSVLFNSFYHIHERTYLTLSRSPTYKCDAQLLQTLLIMLCRFIITRTENRIHIGKISDVAWYLGYIWGEDRERLCP